MRKNEPTMALQIPANSGWRESPLVKKRSLKSLLDVARGLQRGEPSQLRIFDPAFGFGRRKGDLPLFHHVDVGFGGQPDRLRRTDNLRVPIDHASEFEPRSGADHGGEIGNIAAFFHVRKVLEQRLAIELRVIGLRRGTAAVVGIDDGGIEKDLEPNLGRVKRAHPFYPDAADQKEQKRQGDCNGGDAVKAEAHFRGIAALHARPARRRSGSRFGDGVIHSVPGSAEPRATRRRSKPKL